MRGALKKISQSGFIFAIIFAWIFSGWPQIWNNPSFPPSIQTALADVTTLTTTSCDLDDVANATCQSAVSADGGTTFDVGKNSHIDAPLQTLSGASSVNSATFSYDHGPSVVSGTWQIFVTDTRDGTTICSVDPAAEASSEQTDSFSCNSITPTQLSNGVWVRIVGETDKSPENVTLDYLRLQVDYEVPAVSAPTVTTNAATSIVFDGATLNGEITATGGEDATEHGFAYGTDSTLATVIATTTLGSKTGTGTFNEAVSSLDPETTYYFRAYATNSGGTGYGSILNFATDAATISVTITANGTISYGTIVAGGSKATHSGDLNTTITAQNDGDVTETFNIKGQDTACPWTLAASSGSDQYAHQFCKTTDVSCTSPPTNYTALTTSYQTLYTSVAASASRDIDLRVIVPDPSSCSNQQSVDVVIQAVQE